MKILFQALAMGFFATAVFYGCYKQEGMAFKLLLACGLMVTVGNLL